MAWQSYNLDQVAHDLVLKYRDNREALNQAYKMRLTVPYGLERFWGEQIRLQGSDKGNYWRDTWNDLVSMMRRAGVELPNDNVNSENTEQIQQMSKKLWELDQEKRKVALAVLIQLTEAMVWWTQRYK